MEGYYLFFPLYLMIFENSLAIAPLRLERKKINKYKKRLTSHPEITSKWIPRFYVKAHN